MYPIDHYRTHYDKSHPVSFSRKSETESKHEEMDSGQLARTGQNYKKSLFIKANTSLFNWDSNRKSETRKDVGTALRKRIFEPKSASRNKSDVTAGAAAQKIGPSLSPGLNYSEYSPKMKPLSKNQNYHSLSKLGKKTEKNEKDPAFRTIVDIKRDEPPPRPPSKTGLKFTKEETIITVSKSVNFLKLHEDHELLNMRKSSDLETMDKKSHMQVRKIISDYTPTNRIQLRNKNFIQNLVSFAPRKPKPAEPEKKKKIEPLEKPPLNIDLPADHKSRGPPTTNSTKRSALFNKFFFKPESRQQRKSPVAMIHSHSQVVVSHTPNPVIHNHNHISYVSNVSQGSQQGNSMLSSHTTLPRYNPPKKPPQIIQRLTHSTMSPYRTDQVLQILTTTDLSLLIKSEDFIHQFLECFNSQADIFDLFNKYIEWVEENDFQPFLDLIAVAYPANTFKIALICERMSLLVIFYLYTKGLYRTEIIFIKKTIIHVYRNFQEFFKTISQVLKEAQMAEKIPSIPIRNLTQFGPDLGASTVEMNNEKILKILEVEIQSEEREIYEAFNKLRQLMDDFTLNESLSYFKSTFISIVFSKVSEKWTFQAGGGTGQIQQNGSHRRNRRKQQRVLLRKFLSFEPDHPESVYS